METICTSGDLGFRVTFLWVTFVSYIHTLMLLCVGYCIRTVVVNVRIRGVAYCTIYFKIIVPVNGGNCGVNSGIEENSMKCF